MKSFVSVLFGAAALASQASAHYIFQQFTYGGTKFPVYQYIRQNTNMNSPVTDLTSTDLRCNVGGLTGGSTQTITVKAGDSFTITSDIAVYHNGPVSIYMAKVPAGQTAASFDGSGSVWFKTLDLGPTFDSSGNAVWPLAQTYTSTIPSALPSGDYLLRIQQLGIHNPYPAGIPQFYISCTQVTVTNGGSGTPGPLVAIPGFIKGDEPGYTVNIYTNFKNYTVPGPAVWSGTGGTSPAPGTTSATTPGTTTAATKPVTSAPATTSTTAPATSSTGVIVAKYGQCGGSSWTGGTTCVAGTKCTVSNQFYSQCL
ncbi:glycosyl hydrolase family 61-domain-containing protein [Tricladium varicosporioides]|nr:glycosyl hydrolase family 61-domain-containing protein [Hymenoscyphus varicosporioides]